MTSKSDQRPISPYMLGPYYRFQMTSFLSITNRMTGVFLAVVAAPLMVLWLASLAAGPALFDAYTAFLGSVPGKLIALICLYCFAYHLTNGIRHLVWDTASGIEMPQIHLGGWIMLLFSVLLTVVVWWAGS